ncbi:hypothetical protein [Embleya sp. NPDC059237]|uniref:hypothetical protein n=1 Tax=Embleya sp. NPDC059237 TaxID=3346784 RepID=UPI0036AF3B7A
MNDAPLYPQSPVTLDRPEPVPAPAQAPAPVREPLVDAHEPVAAEGASPAALAQEIEALAPDGYLRAELTGDIDGETMVCEVVALMPGKWRASTLRLLRAGDFDGFMASVLTAESYDAYLELDPDQDQFQAFVEDLSAKGGESVGKSRGRRASVTRMRRK